jgi:cytochrome c
MAFRRVDRSAKMGTPVLDMEHKEAHMKNIIKAVVIGLCLLVINTGRADAADRGNADEAAALVKKAVAYLKENGKEKAFVEFNNVKGQFVDRNLYIFVYNMSGKNLAHGANPRMVGKDQIEMKDVDGKYIIRSFIELTSAKGSGWVDYKWPNPVTKAIESKSSYVEKVDDVIIGCGIYKQ